MNPAEMPLDKARETLLRRCDEETARCIAANFRLPVELDLLSALCIIGNLQLALRHQGNTGPSAKVARDAIDGMIRNWIEEATREGLSVEDALPDTLAATSEALGILPAELRLWIFDQPAHEWSGAALAGWARRMGFSREVLNSETAL